MKQHYSSYLRSLLSFWVVFLSLNSLLANSLELDSQQANWTITFAPDWEGNYKETIPVPFIDIQQGTFDNLSFNIIENTFPADDNYCVKVERIYQVINNNLLTPTSIPLTIRRPEDLNGNVMDSLEISSDSLGEYAHLFYKQILLIRSTEKPTLTIQDVDVCLMNVPTDATYLKVDTLENCAENRDFSATATDCVGNLVTKFQWSFYENELRVDTGVGATFTKAVFPNIDYTVQFIAIDTCNNQTEERRNFTFLDCVNPTLFTRTRLAVELKEKEHKINATDFDIGSYDNCTDKATLLDNFRIWHDKLGFDYPEDLATIKTLPTSITFTCAELATQEVFIYAFDAADNFDFVSVFVMIQDNQESCLERDRTTIIGQIINENGAKIEQVNIGLAGDIEWNELTDINGQYLFNLPKGKNYSIEPTKRSNPLNGITTFDLILINKHILGSRPFTSPYQHIAADVNKSGTITAYDLVQLRQLILNIISDFPTNTSWRFVDSRYDFVTKIPENERFTEKIRLTNIEVDQIEFNFIGVKIGDIDKSSTLNKLEHFTKRKKVEIFSLLLEDQLIKAGQQAEIPFTIPDLTNIEGIQFALKFEALEVVNLIEGIAIAEHFNLTKIDRGALAISWHRPTHLVADNPLFTLKVKAKHAGLLSELLTIEETNMLAEIYTIDEKKLHVNLQFTNTTTDKAAELELFQNKPNPFNTQTLLTFHLPKSGVVDLKIMDLQGRILQRITREYDKGLQEIAIDKRDLSTTGLLYYQLTVGKMVITKKMILLE